jgi:hypothetical protein
MTSFVSFDSIVGVNMTGKSAELVPAKSSAAISGSPTSYKNELQTFEKNLMTFIGQHDLPTGNVLVPVAERVTVFGNVENVLALLDYDHKQQSIYISKFIAAAASGLFDAALNYLWDENHLRTAEASSALRPGLFLRSCRHQSREAEEAFHRGRSEQAR